ncbi:hypothetical protein ACU686_02360 [Yinghuangia aomiensis]
MEGGYDPRRFVADLLVRLRDLVILAAVPDAADKGLIDVPGDQLERMVGQARAFGQAELTRAADIVNTGLTEMRGATSPRLQLELICARVLLPGADARRPGLRRAARPAGAAGRTRRPGVGVRGSPPRPCLPRRPRPRRTSTTLRRCPAPPRAPRPRNRRHRPRLPARQPRRPSPHRRRSRSGRTPGAWPSSSRAPQQAAAPQSAQSAPAAQAAPAQSAPAPQASAPQGGGGDVNRVRGMWPQIIDAVKGRKRVTWMLLQRASVAGFDGKTLQVAFENAGTRDGFVNSGHDEVPAPGDHRRVRPRLAHRGHRRPRLGRRRPRLRLERQLGRRRPRIRPAPPRSPRPPQPAASAPSAGGWPATSRAPQDTPPPQSAPPPPEPEPQAPPPDDYVPPEYAPPPVAPEDDIAAYDDEDIADDAFTSHELLVRELGATVIEETRNM